MNAASRRLLVIAKDRTGSSTRYRAGQFVPGLEQAGWQVQIIATSTGLGGRRQMLAAARGADVVLVLRKTFGPITTWLLRRAARRLVFDFDDAIFLASTGQPSRTRYRRFARMVRAADQVWAGNPFLADVARSITSRVHILPTVLNERRYHSSPNAINGEGTIDLVWIGSRSTRKYLEKLIPVLNRLVQLRPELRLKIVADFDLPTLQMPHLRVDWAEQVEVEALATAHIGIAPMIDNPWTHGKCGLKVLQYMAASLPVVTDAVGVNQEMVVNECSGMVVNDHEKWVAAVLKLSADASLRARFGDYGRRRLVEQGYTVGANLQKMCQLLDFTR
jgi:glycosyltransferase involved in cell wall biosynthesis